MNSKENLKSTNFILFLGFCLVLIGLFIFSQKPKVEIISLATPIPLITPTPIPVFAKVTKIIDGDTIVIESGQHVRYIGMNTPEMETSECYATAASEINKNLVIGKTVRLEKDVSEIDKYGRLLRYVYLDGQMVNDELLKEGAAKIMTVPPDTKYKNEFLSSQNYAKENKLGLWGKCSK